MRQALQRLLTGLTRANHHLLVPGTDSLPWAHCIRHLSALQDFAQRTQLRGPWELVSRPVRQGNVRERVIRLLKALLKALSGMSSKQAGLIWQLWLLGWRRQFSLLMWASCSAAKPEGDFRGQAQELGGGRGSAGQHLDGGGRRPFTGGGQHDAAQLCRQAPTPESGTDWEERLQGDAPLAERDFALKVSGHAPQGIWLEVEWSPPGVWWGAECDGVGKGGYCVEPERRPSPH
eukprot:jgi/Botrbrau1/4893/Bobra.118_1s0007.1